jgi:hypothetical protein
VSLGQFIANQVHGHWRDGTQSCDYGCACPVPPDSPNARINAAGLADVDVDRYKQLIAQLAGGSLNGSEMDELERYSRIAHPGSAHLWDRARRHR